MSKPKIVFIFPDRPEDEGAETLDPPLGIVALGSYLQGFGYKVKLIENTPEALIGKVVSCVSK